jgi:hypothetical protein
MRPLLAEEVAWGVHPVSATLRLRGRRPRPHVVHAELIGAIVAEDVRANLALIDEGEKLLAGEELPAQRTTDDPVARNRREDRINTHHLLRW